MRVIFLVLIPFLAACASMVSLHEPNQDGKPVTSTLIATESGPCMVAPSIYAIRHVSGRAEHSFYHLDSTPSTIYVKPGSYHLNANCPQRLDKETGLCRALAFTSRAPTWLIDMPRSGIYELKCNEDGSVFADSQLSDNKGFNRTPESSRAAKPGELSGGAG